MTFNRLFTVGAAVVVAAGLALAFAFLGTPAHQRLVSMDEQRLDDVETIAVSLHERYQSGAGLPDKIPAKVYEFHRIDPTHYSLCALFATYQGAPRDSVNAAWPIREWPHPAGRKCYYFDATEPPSPWLHNRD